MRDEKSGRFLKGNIPYNKGMKGIHLSPESEFKPGHIPESFKGEDHEYRYMRRHEVIVSINQKVPGSSRGKKYLTRRRVSKARKLWMEAYGDVPEGYVVYNNGEWHDVKLKNLECITRAELVRRNSKRKARHET